MQAIMKFIRITAILAFSLIVIGCAPSPVTLRNLGNATPAKIAQLPGLQQSAPTTSSYVLIWELYGTPTLRPGVQPTQQVQPTQPPTLVAAQPTTVQDVRPTLPPTATKPVAADTSPDTSSGAPVAAVKGDPARGKNIFASAGCAGCHDVNTGATLVGPTMKGIALRAGTRKPPMNAVDYLHESVTKPNAFVVKGFTAGVMVQNYGQTLKSNQVDDLVAYLLTLK
jgi:cytochrome c